MQNSRRLRRNSNLNSMDYSKKGLGPISNALFLAVIITMLGLLYLSQVTKANDYSFTISGLESQKEQLIEENQSLAVEAARLASIENVQKSEVARALSEPRSVDFVRP